MYSLAKDFFNTRSQNQILWFGLMFLLFCYASCICNEVGFEKQPACLNANGKLEISFRVKAFTDVDITIINKDGVVVRNLVSGLLGNNAPEPLQKNSLEQKLIWDLCDDSGEPAKGAPFKAVVKLGIKAEFDRCIQNQETQIDAPNGIAVGQNGEVYVLSSGNENKAPRMFVLDRNGKYLRTILPPPAGLKREQLKGLEPIKLADGSEVPFVYNAHHASFAPGVLGLYRQQLFINPQGKISFCTGGTSLEEVVMFRSVLSIMPDGTMPTDTGFVGPSLEGEHVGAGLAGTLTISPDNKNIYLVGVERRSNKQFHAVYKMTWDETKGPQPFIGKVAEAGAGENLLNTPKGLTVDTNGNILVSDYENKRIAVFTPEGKYLGETKVERPTQLFVHPKTGALYVLTAPQLADKGKEGPFAIIKFDKTINGNEVKRIDFRGFQFAWRYDPKPIFAIDFNAEPLKIWLAYLPSGGRAEVMVPIEEKDDKFVVGEDILKLDSKKNWFMNPLFIGGVDSVNQKLYIGSGGIYVIDLKTDQVSPIKSHLNQNIYGTDLTVDREGNLYVLGGYGSNFLSKFGPDGKPVLFSSNNSNKLPVLLRGGYANTAIYGLTIAPNNDIYVYQGDKTKLEKITVYSKDGNVKSEGIVDGMFYESATSVAVDRSGNIYAGIVAQDLNKLYPNGMGDELYKDAKDPRWARPYMDFYLYHGGSVFKFPPKGGRFWASAKKGLSEKPAEVPEDAIRYQTPTPTKNDIAKDGFSVWCQGALWRYRGFSPNAHRAPQSGDNGCSCWSNGRFSLDEQTRLFVPDALRASIGILDTNGNELIRFGRYGNFDAAGPKSKMPAVDIPLAWPTGVVVNNGKAYVLDRLNKRVVVVNIGFKAEASCNIETK